MMEYIIKTDFPEHSMTAIIEGTEKNEDEKGSSIETWSIKTIAGGKKAFVHIVDAWENKGCVILSANNKNGEIRATFHYWTSCSETEKHPYDAKYMLGRFTELILVHFESCYDKIIIES